MDNLLSLYKFFEEENLDNGIDLSKVGYDKLRDKMDQVIIGRRCEIGAVLLASLNIPLKTFIAYHKKHWPDDSNLFPIKENRKSRENK